MSTSCNLTYDELPTRYSYENLQIINISLLSNRYHAIFIIMLFLSPCYFYKSLNDNQRSGGHMICINYYIIVFIVFIVLSYFKDHFI